MKRIKPKVPVVKRSERAIQAQILKLLHARGIVAFGLQRERAGRERASHIGVKGMADICGWIPRHSLGAVADNVWPVARSLWIEVKAPGQKPTLEQKRFLDWAEQDGCLAFYATSCEDVARVFGWKA